MIKKARKEEADFFKRIYPLLYELLTERGGLVLVDQRNIILWDNSVDLTEEAIAIINKVLGDGRRSNRLGCCNLKNVKNFVSYLI